MGRKVSPTTKLALQLTPTAMEVAKGRPPWLKSSDTRNHGIDPGPTANMTTNKITHRMEMYESHWVGSGLVWKTNKNGRRAFTICWVAAPFFF